MVGPRTLIMKCWTSNENYNVTTWSTQRNISESKTCGLVVSGWKLVKIRFDCGSSASRYVGMDTSDYIVQPKTLKCSRKKQKYTTNKWNGVTQRCCVAFWILNAYIAIFTEFIVCAKCKWIMLRWIYSDYVWEDTAHYQCIATRIQFVAIVLDCFVSLCVCVMCSITQQLKVHLALFVV